MSYIWFWSFWHWATEGFRTGSEMRDPVHGIASHWDEWFRHEASEEDQRAIDRVGADRRSQRAFVGWVVRHWAREARWRAGPPPTRFVLAQLGRAEPFRGWALVEESGNTCYHSGVDAIVLAEGSHGAPTDVRTVAAMSVPRDFDPLTPPVATEGFEADSAALETARQAALSIFSRIGLMRLITIWLLIGERPYRRAIHLWLRIGWIGLAVIIIGLLFGPDLGRSLHFWVALPTVLWCALMLTAIGAMGLTALQTWRAGRVLGQRLAESQVRLRMHGGLRVAGASAGLPFALDVLLALLRDQRDVMGSAWLWRRITCGLRRNAASWAATGAVTTSGDVVAVVLEPKLRACLAHASIAHVLTPRQREARARAVSRIAVEQTAEMGGSSRRATGAVEHDFQWGFAAGRKKLAIHRVRNLVGAVLQIAELPRASQRAVNLLAAVCTLLMAAALPDIANILNPPQAPMVIGPRSPSPYSLWVSLDTRDTRHYSAVLESGFWANRRADVISHGSSAPVRAQLPLTRLRHFASMNEEDGIVWVERRRRFLGREFAGVERVGRYSLAYLTSVP